MSERANEYKKQAKRTGRLRWMTEKRRKGRGRKNKIWIKKNEFYRPANSDRKII